MSRQKEIVIKGKVTAEFTAYFRLPKLFFGKKKQKTAIYKLRYSSYNRMTLFSIKLQTYITYGKFYIIRVTILVAVFTINLLETMLCSQ